MDKLRTQCVALSGGVGGAKLALGLAQVLTPDELVIVANTGDDFEHLGLSISPDLDTVMYTLADLANRDLGWGQQGETWAFLDAMTRLGGETWFRLGDRDLATHVIRSNWLRQGRTLSEATAHLCAKLGIAHRLVPMTDDRVPTIVIAEGGERLAFQHYFVRDRCAPVVTGFEFAGVDRATASPGFEAALRSDALECVIICPSNPFVSVDPVLAVPGVLPLMQSSQAKVVAVSPIVGGQAIKGPAAKMMAELGMPQTALSVAQHYEGRIDGFVLDHLDADYRSDVESLGMRVLVTRTMMVSLEDRVQLARDVLAFAQAIEKNI